MERRMACQVVQTWSLIGLVAAFLDLAIAYLLLCASSVAYLASQFLGFFGLSLPCPCDGIFLNIDGKILCLNRLLVDFPIEKVSDVHVSVKHKFPFGDPKKSHDYNYSVDNCVNDEILEIEGEGSCSSVDSVRKEVYDMKGKGVISNNRPRSRLRHRKYSSVSSCGVLGRGHYGHSVTQGENRFIEGSSLQVDDGEAQFLEYDNKDPPKIGLRKLSNTSFETSHSPNANAQKKRIHIEEAQTVSNDEKNAIRHYEQKLEEERIARAALYIELEKERSAAASAADEAMSMIFRLQEEKASIEMEARQYQRILEEKSTYDAEEMNILKEILVRREKEKHFLEKEVEAYRQMDEKESKQIEVEKIIVTCDPKLDKESIDVHVIEPNGSSENRVSSLSTVESEMMRIDCEVGRFRERLRLVRKGREKVSLCAEGRERENIQLRLLEDIARQVQEIRQLSGDGKSLRQMSLPLPTSKVLSKKRRSKSVSSGFQRSSEGSISN